MSNLSGATTAVFIVRLSAALEVPVTVAWKTKDGTAKAGTDYEAASGSVTFEPGETTKQIQVAVYGRAGGDTETRTFGIELYPPENAILDQTLTEVDILVTDESGTAVTSLVVATGPRGVKGDPGLSAYELAKLQGYPGTLEDWLQTQTAAGDAAERAAEFAEAAAVEVGRAELEANRSGGEADRAEQAAENAEAKANTELTFSDIAAGIAGTTNGQYFRVIHKGASEDAFTYYRNNAGVAEEFTSEPSSAAVRSVNVAVVAVARTQTEMIASLSDTLVASSSNIKDVTIVSDSAFRKLLKLDITNKKLTFFGKDVADTDITDTLGQAASETWLYHGENADRIILLADSAGRIIRYLNLTEKSEYLFGKKVGTGTSQSYVPPKSWPEFVDNRSYGQSLSISIGSGPGILTTVNGALMFNAGIVTYQKALASLTTIQDTTSIQYHETSLIHQLQRNNPEPDRKHFAAASGVSGYSMAQLEPGTVPFTQFMASIDKAAELAQAAGYQYGMPALTFFQGEADAYQGSTYAYYRQKQRLIQSTVNEKVKAVSRVESDMPMIIYQMASHGRYEGLVEKSTEIPRAQLDEAIENPLIQCCTPMYIFPYTDGVHLTNHGYRWLGLFREKAISHWMRTGTPWKPLYPTDIFKVGDKTIVGVFHVPVGALQFRTDIVPEHPSGAKGFELWQETADPNVLERLEIASVQLNGGDKVKVTSATPFTGKVYLGYGWTPLNRGAYDGAGRYPSWNAGVNSGVCGNLCDSDESTTDLLNANGAPYQLKNYCCIFLKEAK